MRKIGNRFRKGRFRTPRHPERLIHKMGSGGKLRTYIGAQNTAFNPKALKSTTEAFD
jgi:hypothetical protein